jgi:hypothetical protein
MPSIFDVLPFEQPQLVPGGFPAELCAPDKFHHLVTVQKRAAIELVRHHKGHPIPLSLYLMCKRNPITVQSEQGLWRMCMRSTDQRGEEERFKRMFIQIARLTATRGEALGYVLFSEAWMSGNVKGAGPEGTYAQAKDDPQAIDVLMVLVKTREHGAMYSAPIQRSGNLTTLDPFVHAQGFESIYEPILDPIDLDAVNAATIAMRESGISSEDVIDTVRCDRFVVPERR